MPSRKTYKKKRTKKVRARGHSNYSSYSGYPSGMPRVRRAYLRYSDQIDMTSGSGTITHHSFRASSVYDPDFTGTGHQPLGFDQWTPLYNHYVVVGSRITVTPLNDTTSTSPYVVGVYLSEDSAAAYLNWSGYKEAKKGSQRLYNGGAQNTKPTTSVAKYSAKKFFNITDIKDNVTRIGSITNTNPTDNAFFNVYYQNVNSTTDTKTMLVTIDFIVDFSEPKNLTPS